jgi:hypothetical protein
VLRLLVAVLATAIVESYFARPLEELTAPARAAPRPVAEAGSAPADGPESEPGT